jgi:ElaB/YqjD/DUF883 family membrane-anchored ribosome-binding protein
MLMKRQPAARHYQLPDALRHDAHTLVEDAQALLEATAEITDNKVTEARKRLADALENGQELYQDVRNRVVSGAQAADQMFQEKVQENPYRALGFSFGVGFLLGMLMKRRA